MPKYGLFLRKMTSNVHFFEKIFGHVRKKQYLCGRFCEQVNFG